MIRRSSVPLSFLCASPAGSKLTLVSLGVCPTAVELIYVRPILMVLLKRKLLLVPRI